MKNSILLLTILFSWIIFSGNIFGQDGNKKIHLKVIKNGKTTVDTNFAAGSLEEDELHKKISELAGVEIDMADGKHKHMVHVDSHGDYSWTAKENEGSNIIIVKSAKDGDHKTMSAFYTTDDKGNFSIEADSSIIIDGDTVSFEKKGNVFIMDGDDKTIEWVEKDSDDVKNLKVIVEKVGEDDEDHDVIIIKDGDVIMKGDGKIILEEIDEDDHIKVIRVKKGDEGDKKSVNIYVSDEEGHTHTHKSGNVQIFVTDEESGTEIVSKKVKVVKSKGEGVDEIEITIEVIEDEDVKVEEVTKEKSKKTKQKKVK